MSNSFGNIYAHKPETPKLKNFKSQSEYEIAKVYHKIQVKTYLGEYMLPEERNKYHEEIKQIKEKFGI